MSDLAFTRIQRAVAAAVPDRAAVTWRGMVTTHAELLDRTARIANLLSAIGIGTTEALRRAQRWQCPQDTVAILMLNRPEFIESLLGIFAARAVAVNVNYRYTPAEVAHVLEVTHAQAVIYETRFSSTIDRALDLVGHTIRRIEVTDHGTADAPTIDYRAALDEQSAGLVDRQWSPHDRYLVMTGGTTGAPKAVLWNQEDIFVAAMGGWPAKVDAPFSQVSDVVSRIAAESRPTVSAPPFMHGAGQWSALAALFSGNTVAIQSVIDRLDPADVWTCVQQNQATTLLIAGDAFGRPLWRELTRQNYELHALRFIISGAVALTAEVKIGLQQCLPSVVIIENAGASESGSQLSVRTTGDNPMPGNGVFTPRAGTVILSEDRRSVVAPDSREEGWLARRRWVPLGYLDAPDETTRTFPIVNGERYSIPGDRARYQTSESIQLLGRDSLVINTGGEKVYVEEVEQCLAAHPAVDDAVVVGRPSERWGQQVCAVVALRNSCPTEELRTWAAASLAAYKLPKQWRVVEEVQRGPAGKPDYRWAAAQFDTESQLEHTYDDDAEVTR